MSSNPTSALDRTVHPIEAHERAVARIARRRREEDVDAKYSAYLDTTWLGVKLALRGWVEARRSAMPLAKAAHPPLAAKPRR